MSKEDIKSNEFQYVVEKKEPDRVCFGSGLKRDTNPIGAGLSSYQRRFATEIFTKISPQTYYVDHLTAGVSRLYNKVRSNKGVGGLASNTSRFPQRIRHQAPSPTRYNIQRRKRVKKNKIPFNNSLPLQVEVKSKTPGVGYYDIVSKRGRRTKFDYNFGKPSLVPAVEVICTAYPTDACEKCGEICQDDYWHRNHTLFLCNFCKEVEKITHEKYTTRILRKYEKIRTCSFMHNHEGTDVAENLLSKINYRKDSVSKVTSIYILILFKNV